MAEQFLTLMAVLDDESQKTMTRWYDELRAAAFHARRAFLSGGILTDVIK